MPAGPCFVFAPFELDPGRRRLTSSGEPVAISERQLDVLLLLVVRAGQIVSKEDLLQAGWNDVAVGDNSLEQAISSLRRLLGGHPGGVPYIETVPRRGYRFSAPVARKAPRESDAGLDALLAPHRAFIEGRSALETFDGGQVARARGVFEDAVRTAPEGAAAHVGLANACVMQFEMTRTDPTPDAAALATAAHHAREACRLDPQSGEAWATLGFVLDRTGDRIDAPAAAKRAVTLEPANWRHHFRLGYVAWGQERLHAAHRTLALLPDFPQAHWLAATVYVARQAFNEAEREVMTALASQASGTRGDSRFTSVALHWLLGLLRLARGDETGALEAFERELAVEDAGHLYARECCANTWYAIGALRLRQGRLPDASAAFERALERVASHPMARVGLVAAGSLDRSSIPALAAEPRGGSGIGDRGSGIGDQGSEIGDRASDPRPPSPDPRPTLSVDAAMFRAAQMVVAGAHPAAARIVEDALADAAPGNAGWLLPIEPLLRVTAHPDVWARALSLLRNRAA